MNSAYLYLQLYRLFDDITPVSADCGGLCDKACCDGDDGGMYLFPGEESVYKLLSPDWMRIEKSDFTYTFEGKEKNAGILFCNGRCDRFQRPLACRIFPLTPYIGKDNELRIITDPRAKSICPLAKALNIDDYNPKFVRNVRSAFILLSKNREVYEFLREYSAYLDEYLKFLPE